MKRLTFLLLLIISYQASSQTALNDDILSTWDKHVEMNGLLMTAVKSEYLRDTTSSGGRNIADQFAHMHNVRMMWLSQLNPESKMEDLDPGIDAIESLRPGYLKSQLSKSSVLIRNTISQGLENKDLDWPMSPVRFMAYLISHESHTRGQILLALKQSSHPAPPQVAFGIWQWE